MRVVRFIRTLGGMSRTITIDCLYFPIIAEDDFESFRNIIHDELPVTYKEWLKREADRIARYRETHRIINVKVKSSDFATYLSAGGNGTHLKRLWDFAELVGKRRRN